MKPPQISLQQIISFYFVGKEESFSVASEKLFVTQPAVTQHIKGLETQFGVKLINVKRKRVHLTKAGERFLDYAEEIVNHVTMAENFLKSFSVNNLQLGVACTLMLYLTPIIDRFKELHPSVRLAVREGPSLMLVKDLLDLKYDVCLVGTLREVDRRLQVFRIPQVEKMVLVAAPDYPLVLKKKVRWEDLVNYPLIIQSEGSVAREIILEHFKKAGLRPLIGAEVDNVECAKELARQKKGVALMFLPNVKDEVARENLKIIPIAGGEIRLGIDVVINRETYMSPAIKTFLPVIEEYFNYQSFQQKVLTPAV